LPHTHSKISFQNGSFSQALRSYALRTPNGALAGTIRPTTQRMHTADDKRQFYYLLGIWKVIILSRHSYSHSHCQICYQHEEAPALFRRISKTAQILYPGWRWPFWTLVNRVWHYTAVILSEVNGNTSSTNLCVF